MERYYDDAIDAPWVPKRSRVTRIHDAAKNLLPTFIRAPATCHHLNKAESYLLRLRLPAAIAYIYIMFDCCPAVKTSFCRKSSIGLIVGATRESSLIEQEFLVLVKTEDL